MSCISVLGKYEMQMPMDQASHHNRPPFPRREPTATSVTIPQWNSPDDPDLSASGPPPPPYSVYEETPPAHVPRMRPAVTMPIQTGFSYNPATWSENGQSPTIPSFDPPPSRPVSRGNGYNPSQYQQPGPGAGPVLSQSLQPPNRLRVMTSMPNISSTAGRFDHSPVSSVSSRPASPNMTAFTPSPATTIAPNHRGWPDQSRPTTPIYHNLPPPPPPPSGPLPPPPPPRPGPRPLQNLPTSKQPTSNPATPSPSSPNPSSTTPKSLLTSALHFAGGLIPHPYESTKQYTILRHSPALIFYRGPKTSLAITIFSSPSCPLPADRSLWLQQRGFSGDTGLKLKQLVGATSTWLDVTPSTQVQTSDLEPNTSKAWERDIAKAVRKISREMGNEKAHVPRQTHVVRIPEAAEDGYFRLVLCVGGVEGSKEKRRKVVCQSPVFRVASTSSDSSVLRGASLSTMPIELGVKVASFMASNVVQRYTAPVSAIADRVRPGLVKEEVGKRVFKAVGERVKNGPKENGSGGDQFYGSEGGSSPCDTMGMGTMAVGIGMGMGGMVVGGEEGPEQPFPIKFQGRVGRGTGKGRQELGMPTANLVGVPDDIKSNLRGVYFGWACLLPGRGVDPAIIAENCWYEAVIMATKSAYASVIQETDVKVYLAHEFGDGMVSFTEAKMKVIAMGFIRPEVQPARGTVASVQDRLEMASQDVMVTMASLSRENWGPDMTLDKLKTAKSSRSLSDKFGDVKTKVQRTVDRVPGHAHVAGIRVGGGEERDRIHGTGGYWVAR